MATTLPDEKHIEAASAFEVFDSKGQKVKFGDLISEQKTVVVFIRHFFCGACQAYASQLAGVKDEALKEAGTKIILIGCGEYEPIQFYAETTGFKGPIYADPTRALFRHFDLTSTFQNTPAGEAKKSYMADKSFLGAVFGSIWRGPVKNPLFIGKQGNFAQLGGDFVFGPGNTCSFASRMKHTEDHVEVADLMKGAGVQFP